MRRAALVILTSLCFACGGEQTPADPAAGAIDVGGATIDARTGAGVAAFLEGGAWQAWTKETAAHASLGPHGQVQTWFGPRYVEARRAETTPMPVGAMAIKVLYDGDTLDGYAVAIKTSTGAAASTWTWYEAFVPKLTEPLYFGVAVPTCENCHGGSARDRSLTATLP